MTSSSIRGADLDVTSRETSALRETPAYNDALDRLLGRLGKIEASLRVGVVDSEEMKGRPIPDRQLALPSHAYPIMLAAIGDLRGLRLEMGRAQRAIGRKPGAKGGNNTKKIRLSIDLPQPWAVADLETFLVWGTPGLDPDQLDGGPECDALDPSSIASLWDRYRKANPIVKERISRRIERGPVGSVVKKANHHRCQLCDALNRPWRNFTKLDGGLYIEAHHVVPVSALGVGVLGPANIVTVCPNHHRQLHFGRVKVTDTGDVFSFEFDGGDPVDIRKFCEP
jgi:hypothetical protein